MNLSFLHPVFLRALQIAVIVFFQLHCQLLLLSLVEQRHTEVLLMRVIPPAPVCHAQNFSAAKAGVSERVLGGLNESQVTLAVVDPFEVGFEEGEVLVVFSDVGVAYALGFAVAGGSPDIAFAIVLFVVLPDCLGDLNHHFGEDGFPDAGDFPLQRIDLLVLLVVPELVGPVVKQVSAEHSEGSAESKDHEILRAVISLLAHYHTSLTIIIYGIRHTQFYIPCHHITIISIFMRAAKIPSLIRNAVDGSITLSYQQAKYSLIWLHGGGDVPDSYLPYFTHLLSPLYNRCRIRLLATPHRTVTNNFNQTPLWYDGQSDIAHINKSNDYLHQCFTQEMEHWKQIKQGDIPAAHRIYVGGMGQGASIALNYAYSAEQIPAGAIALSGSLLPSSKLSNLRKMPALVMHGLKDQVIRQISARKSYSQLLKDEYLVQYKVIEDLEHNVNLQELTAMRQWLQESHEFIRKHYQTAQ